jgi:large subunit ribosomal protein L15
MKLNELKDNEGATQNRTRVGRGIGSGKGKTCGRGYKGQGSRTGVSNLGEGGQTPIFRRLPKRGFTSHNRTVVETLNVQTVEQFIEAKKIKAGEKITRATLNKLGLVRAQGTQVKILAKGAVKSKIEIEVDQASKSAIEAIEKAGGKVTLIAKKVHKQGKKEAA